MISLTSKRYSHSLALIAMVIAIGMVLVFRQSSGQFEVGGPISFTFEDHDVFRSIKDQFEQDQMVFLTINDNDAVMSLVRVDDAGMVIYGDLLINGEGDSPDSSVITSSLRQWVGHEPVHISVDVVF